MASWKVESGGCLRLDPFGRLRIGLLEEPIDGDNVKVKVGIEGGAVGQPSLRVA